MALHQSSEPLSVRYIPLLGQHDLGAHAQRQQQLEYGNVKAQGRHRQKPILPSDARFPGHAREKIDDGAVWNDDTLWRSGRAGRVDNVSRVFGTRIQFAVPILRIRRELIRRLSIDMQRSVTRPRDAISKRRLSDKKCEVGVLRHVREPLYRVSGVERDPCGSGANYGQLRDKHRYGSLQAQAHMLAASDTAFPQQVCEGFCPAIQFPVRKACCATSDRGRPHVFDECSIDHRSHRFMLEIATGSSAPVGHPRAFLLSNQRQL